MYTNVKKKYPCAECEEVAVTWRIYDEIWRCSDCGAEFLNQ